MPFSMNIVKSMDHRAIFQVVENCLHLLRIVMKKHIFVHFKKIKIKLCHQTCFLATSKIQKFPYQSIIIFLLKELSPLKWLS